MADPSAELAGSDALRFSFELKNAAGNNSPKAQVRECTRMASLCMCLHIMGHASFIKSAPAPFQLSDRWRFFKHLYDPNAGGIDVVPAEVAKVSHRTHSIGLKCGVGVQHDKMMLRRFRLLVAHEYDEKSVSGSDPKLLRVPFFVHDRVIQDFMDKGVFVAYLRNDLVSIRDKYQIDRPANEKKLLGWCGCTAWKGRRKIITDAPHWVKRHAIKTYEGEHLMSADEHIRWLREHMCGLCLPGDTPKTNLPPLLPIIGVTIVMWPISRFDDPPIDDSNAIMVRDWEEARLQMRYQAHRIRVRRQAEKDYINHWSPMGQAAAIVRKCEELGIR